MNKDIILKKYANYNIVDSNKKGFTLIEVLIVSAIAIILAAAAFPIYGGLQVSSQLNENSSLIIQNIRQARERSAVWLNDNQHGVFFVINSGGADKMVLYQGSSYELRMSAYDRETEFDEALSLSSLGFLKTGNNIDINFSRGQGLPDNVGTIILNHIANGSRQVILNSYGAVDLN